MIYISGPMRGIPELNHPLFREVKERFCGFGWMVKSPVDIGRDAFDKNEIVSSGEYVRVDVRALTYCTAITMLPGWQYSVGARCEMVVARTIGLPFYDHVTGLPVALPDFVICEEWY